MAGAGLQRLAVVHHALDGVGGLGAVELLLLGLAAAGDGHGQHVLAEVRVQVQDPLGEGLGLLGGGVHGVALLPQKFPVAQEGTAALLPAQHAAPLVIAHGQIPVGLDDILEMLAEQGLGGGADAVALLQLLAAAGGDPGALGSKALHMILLLLQQALGDQHGHVDVLHAALLELRIQNVLHILPDRIAVGTVNKQTLDGGVVNELRLFAHIGEPLGKVDLHIRDLLDLLFFRHENVPLFPSGPLPRRNLLPKNTGTIF